MSKYQCIASGGVGLKKVSALAVVIIAVLFFAKFYQPKNIGVLENDAFALINNVLTQNLMKEEITPQEAIVEPEKLESMAPLYELGGRLYAGERKNKLNTAYPLFLNDSAVLLNLNDSAKLVTRDFQRVDSYYGLYVSDGVSFNADRERADAEEFILLQLINKMYINAQQMGVHTICGDVQVPMHSIVNFQEDTIRYYTLNDGQFCYERITKLDEQAFVCFGEQKYRYFEFLKKLGKMRDRTSDYKIAKAKRPEKPEVTEPAVQEVDEEETSAETNSEPPKTPAYRKPRVTMSNFCVDLEENLVSSTLTIHDPAGVLTDEIRVLICGENGTSQIWTFTEYVQAQQGVLHPMALFEKLEKGKKYCASGMFTYIDEKGQKQTEMFGKKTFTMEEDISLVEPAAPVYRKPRVTMSKFRINLEEKLASTTLTIHDPMGALNDEIRVLICGEDGTTQIWTFTDYIESEKGILHPAVVFEKLKKGKKYCASGMFTYIDEQGQKQTEIFGEKTFTMEEKNQPDDFYWEPEPDYTFIKPQVSCEPLTADIYNLKSFLTITEQDSLIGGAVRFEVYRGERLYMRKSVSTVGEFQIGYLPPATEYKVVGLFAYHNEYKQKVEESFLEQTISTLALDNLTPMRLSFKNGEIFHDRIQLIDLCFADDPADSTHKAGFKTIPYVTKIAVQIKNNMYNLNTLQVNTMHNGGKVEYQTPAVLRSNKEYEYAIFCYDRFGNELPLAEPAVGKTHTCKAPPTAVIQLTGNEVANTELSVQIENPDDVQLENCWISVYDLNDNLLPTIIKMENGKDSSPATQHALPDNGGKIVFTNLATGEAYTAVISCDYDLDNGDGLQFNQEIGRTRFTTLSISALGYAIFNTDISELTDTDALLSITLDKNRTNQSLLFLLDKVTVTITAPDGEEIKTVTLKGDEIQELAEEKPLQMQLEYLQGATEYQIKIAAEVEQGTIIHDIKTANNIEKFKTLKTEPQVVIPSYFAVSNSIELYNLIIDDPDGAILSNVNLLVSDSYGRIVGMSILKANTTYDRLSFPKLTENETYTFTFIATEFNKGYDYSTYETLYQLTPVYQIMNENRLTGKIGLQSLDEIAGDTEHFKAKLWVQITDEKKDLFNNPRYTIKVFQEGEAADTLVREIDPAGSAVDTILYYQVEALSEYHLELWVKVHDHELKLDETTFTTEQRIIGLATIQDFEQLRTNMSGKYIVLNDIELTRGPFNGLDAVRFNGELDFQGHKLIIKQSRHLFGEVGKNGVIKNMVLDITIPDNNPLRYRGYIAYRHWGCIQNVIVNVKGCTRYLHNYWGFLSYIIYSTGTIENFVINLESPLYAWQYFGGLAPYNNGTVRNGYVYGIDIELPDIEVEGGYSASTFGGVVGINNTGGRVENVFNLVNIRTGTLVSPSKNSFGLIAGVNNGRLKGAYTTGQVFFGGANDLRYGPAVGNQGGMLQTNAYYISESSTYTNTYNAKVTKETFYDPLWHQAILGNAFEIEEPVLLGYYPRLKMPACMPAQAYLPLPELDVVNTVELASVMVEEQHEDYAIAVFTFKNPGAYNIKKVAVEHLNATVIEESQVDKDEFSRVKVRLDNPTGYYSSYSVMYIGYSISASGSPIIRNYQKGERLVNAEFFKSIHTIEEWTSIEDRMEQNYRLKKDLDFSNIPPQLIRLGEKDANQFTGKLDGGIYDEKEKLIGLHTIRNLDLSVGLGGVITNLKGVVSNLRVEQLILENPTDSYVGFVRRTQSGALVDNVHLNNVRMQGRSIVGGIVGQCTYAAVQNCSVNGLVLKDANVEVTAGGIVGRSSYGMVKNCYSYGLNVLVEKAKGSSGVGGIVGYTNNSEIENCYAVGSIRTTVQYTGGLVGNAGGGNMIQKMWSDVDIVTNGDYIGGMVGYYGGNASEIIPVNTLVLGDLYSSVTTAANVRRVMGNRADMENAYAWSGQRVNGEIPYEADGTTIMGDGAEVLSGDELRNPQTYLKHIELGEFFDYEKVDRGVLPQIFGTDGQLLPYQTEHKLAENLLIRVTDVTAATVGNSYQIQINLSHQPECEIEDAVFDYLHVDTKVTSIGEGKTVLHCTLVGQPVRYLDSYQLKGIRYNGGKLYNVLAQIRFETPFYIDIPDVATWQAVMAERKDNFENFRITGNLDFGNRTDLVYNVNVNRIVGNQGAGGEYTVIKNISLNFPETGQGFINTINADVSNLRFENINLTNTKSGGSNVGVIGKCFGNVENLEFYNVTVNALSASQVGCLGYISGGKITESRVEKVTVKTTGDYVGGVVGRAENVNLTKLNAKETVISGRSQVGGLAGRVIGTVSYSTAEEVTVTGTGTYTGGIAGYEYPMFPGNVITNEELTVKNSDVKGVNYVGGIFGRGQLRNDNEGTTWSRVENTMIIGTGGYVGGLAGNPSAWWNRNGVVSNCQIFGSYYVGGVMGNTSQMVRVFVLDSVISTIYDPQYGEFTGNAVPKPTNQTQNKYIGGITGTSGSTPTSCGVVNCTIGAAKADNVGGIIGQNSGGVYSSFCLDSTVCGRNNIGGLVGYHRLGLVYDCQSNAEVIASGKNAGGLSGYMYINRDLDGSRVPRLVGNYYVGNVSAADYAGGLVGRTSAELSGDNSRLIVAANVTTTGNNGNIVGNVAGGEFTRLRIYNDSMLSVGGTAGRTAVDIYASAPQSSAGMMLVTSAQLKNQSTYTSLSSYFSTGYRNYTSLKYNYMPYLRYSGATMPYQEGKDEATGEYNSPNSYKGGIPIPTGSVAPQMLTPSMMFNMAPKPQELPVPDFYAAGADKLNIEFNKVNEHTGLIVSANGSNLLEQQIDQRVYTLDYDFFTPLKVTVTDGRQEQYYEVDPLSLRRNILTWDTDYYYITDLGVQSGKAGLLAGNFIHLYGGQGLTASGKLCDLIDGSIIKETVGIALCEQAQPLYSFNYNQYQIKTYKNYAESTFDGQTVTRELQLLVKNGSLTALDPTLSEICDGVIVDSVGGSEYMTVLGTDGMLVDLKERLHLPQDFKNSRIVQLSNNLQCTAPYALVRYGNRSVVAFNYLTGEILSTEIVKSDMSLLEYAEDFFKAKFNSVQSDLSAGYLQIVKLKEKLTIFPNTEELAAGDQIDGGNLVGTLNKQEIDGNKTGGASIGGGDSVGGRNSAGENSAGSEKSIGSGDLLGNGEEKTDSQQKSNTAGEKDVPSEKAETGKGDDVTGQLSGEKSGGVESEAVQSVNGKRTEHQVSEGTGTEHTTADGVGGAGLKATAADRETRANQAGTLTNQVGTKDMPDESPLGVHSNVEASNTKAAAGSPTEAAGVLAKSKPQVRKYVAVYDAKTGEYLLYDEKNLLEATNARLAPINKQQVVNILKNEQNAKGIQAVLYENKGNLLLFLTAISIIALLLYIYCKKYRI